MDLTKEQELLNEEWTKLSQEMQLLQQRRREIWDRWKVITDHVAFPPDMRSPSNYYDLTGRDIDLQKRKI